MGTHGPVRIHLVVFRIAMAECEIQRTPYRSLRMPAVPGVGIGTVAGSVVDPYPDSLRRPGADQLSAQGREDLGGEQMFVPR